MPLWWNQGGIVSHYGRQNQSPDPAHPGPTLLGFPSAQPALPPESPICSLDRISPFQFFCGDRTPANSNIDLSALASSLAARSTPQTFMGMVCQRPTILQIYFRSNYMRGLFHEHITNHAPFFSASHSNLCSSFQCAYQNGDQTD